MALLDSDKALVKKLGLNEDHELETEDKKLFVATQVEEMKKILWRNRVDAMLNRNIKTETEDEKDAVAAKIKEHEKEAKQFAEAITLMTQVRDEL